MIQISQGINYAAIRYILQIRKELHLLRQEVKEARERQQRAEGDGYERVE